MLDLPALELEGGKNVVDALGIAIGVFGVFQFLKGLPRFFRYRLLRAFFRFRDGQRVLIVCSELEEPAERQWVEPNEFIYMLKYGDLDALFEMVSMVREVYPNCRLEIVSAGEAGQQAVDYNCDLIVIGGPDYNTTCEKLLKEVDAYVGYEAVLPCEEHADGAILLRAAQDGQRWVGGVQHEDYGYIEVAENPFAPRSRVFFFGGCHTIGVTGAVKALQLKRRDTPGPTPQATANLRRLIGLGRFRRHFAVVFRVALLGATIPTPSIAEAHFFGEPRRVLGVALSPLVKGFRRLGRRPR